MCYQKCNYNRFTYPVYIPEVCPPSDHTFDETSFIQVSYHNHIITVEVVVVILVVVQLVVVVAVLIVLIVVVVARSMKTMTEQFSMHFSLYKEKRMNEATIFRKISFMNLIFRFLIFIGRH